MTTYICTECGESFTKEQADSRKEDDDFKYGEFFLCCPFCQSLEIEEVEEECEK